MLVILTCFTIVGCELKTSGSVDDPLKKIQSFEEVEKEFNSAGKHIDKNAKERLYYQLYLERHEILKIAEGRYDHQSGTHRALIRQMAWVALGEIQQRRPEFEIQVKGTEPEPETEGPESLPEKDKLTKGLKN